MSRILRLLTIHVSKTVNVKGRKAYYTCIKTADGLCVPTQAVSGTHSNVCTRKDWKSHQQTKQQRQCSLLFIETGIYMVVVVVGGGGMCEAQTVTTLQRANEGAAGSGPDKTMNSGARFTRCCVLIALSSGINLFPHIQVRLVSSSYTSTFCCLHINWGDYGLDMFSFRVLWLCYAKQMYCNGLKYMTGRQRIQSEYCLNVRLCEDIKLTYK